jgi:hypothetical protein
MTGTLWERTCSYKALSELATARAIKSTVADIIKFTLSDRKETATVFSLGIGNGDLYKNQLRKEIDEGKLRIFGSERDPFLVKRCREEFPGTLREVSFFYTAEERHSAVMEKSLQSQLATLDIDENMVDIVESRFTLHAFLFQKQLIQMLEKIEKILKPSGTFIVSSIDNWIGNYIEKKFLTLQRFYGDVTLEPETAIISGSRRKAVSLPVLENTNHSDQEALKTLVQSSLEPLKAEGKAMARPGWEDVINLDYDDGIKGRLWYRTKEEWEEMVKSVFGGNAEIRILSPQEIKNRYNDVLDQPFLLMVTKQPAK